MLKRIKSKHKTKENKGNDNKLVIRIHQGQQTVGPSLNSARIRRPAKQQFTVMGSVRE